MKWIYFDLDYTLYDQRAYLRAASAAIAEHFGKPRYYKNLMRLWRQRGTRYPRLFNEFLANEGIFSDKNLRRCIALFHNPPALSLSPYADAVPMLRALQKNNIGLGIITDGNARMQARKIGVLGLEKFFRRKDVHFADRFGGKETGRVFTRIRKNIPRGDELWYVGDNPRTDFRCSKAVGFKTVRLRRGAFKNIRSRESDVDLVIRTLSEIPKRIGLT